MVFRPGFSSTGSSSGSASDVVSSSSSSESSSSSSKSSSRSSASSSSVRCEGMRPPARRRDSSSLARAGPGHRRPDSHYSVPRPGGDPGRDRDCDFARARRGGDGVAVRLPRLRRIPSSPAQSWVECRPRPQALRSLPARRVGAGDPAPRLPDPGMWCWVVGVPIRGRWLATPVHRARVHGPRSLGPRSLGPLCPRASSVSSLVDSSSRGCLVCSIPSGFQSNVVSLGSDGSFRFGSARSAVPSLPSKRRARERAPIHRLRQSPPPRPWIGSRCRTSSRVPGRSARPKREAHFDGVRKGFFRSQDQLVADHTRHSKYFRRWAESQECRGRAARVRAGARRQLPCPRGGQNHVKLFEIRFDPGRECAGKGESYSWVETLRKRERKPRPTERSLECARGRGGKENEGLHTFGRRCEAELADGPSCPPAGSDSLVPPTDDRMFDDRIHPWVGNSQRSLTGEPSFPRLSSDDGCASGARLPENEMGRRSLPRRPFDEANQ